LLDVGGVPILHRILAGLAAAGVHDAAVITGHEAAQLERATGDGSRWGLRISYFRQQELNGTGRALSLSRAFLNGERFFAGWGDIVVEPGNYSRVIAAASRAEAVLAVNEVEDPYAGGAVYAGADWRVSRLVEKPEIGTSTTRWNNSGLMVLPDRIWEFVDALPPSARGEYELPQAVAAMIDAGIPTLAEAVLGPWFDIGTLESLTQAREYFRSG
jgi:dTDP-glucose pyrophosphorylase